MEEGDDRQDGAGLVEQPGLVEQRVLGGGRVNKNYNLWSRNPLQVSAAYLDSGGKSDRPAAETDVNY